MLLLIIFIFLVLSAFFSGSEIAFLSASKLGVEIKRDKGSRRGAILASFYDKPKWFIATMLVGNNIALVVFTYFMTKLLEPAIIDFFGEGLSLLIITLVITLVVLIFGEFLPKTFFRLYANDVLYFLAFPLLFFKALLSLPTWVTTQFSNGILKYIFRKPMDTDDIALTRMDLEDYIEDTIDDEDENVDKDILTNALNLHNLKVRDCMIPRTEITEIDIKSGIEKLKNTFKESGYSRILVSDGDIENIIGYIHHQQLLDNPNTIEKLVLDIPFVPEAMNVKDLMLRFIKNGTNISCVVDEFGGTAGIITLEDILEEIFGEIADEHDEEEFVETVINENEYLFSGRLEIDYLNEKYENLNLPEGEYQTLSGYIVMTSGNIPEENAEIVLDGFKFVLEIVSETKIEMVRIYKLEEQSEENA